MPLLPLPPLCLPLPLHDRSYLPLAHIFETVMQILGLCSGAAVGFYQGNVKLLMDDIQTLRPTVFAGVPRIYSRFYDKVTVEEGCGRL